MRHSRPRAAGLSRGFLVGEGLGGGGGAVDSRESAQRTDALLRHFNNEKGFGGSSPGRTDALQALCKRLWNSVRKGSGRSPSAGDSGRRGETVRLRSANEEVARSPF